VFEGRLEGVEAGLVRLRLEGDQLVALPLPQIDKARLVPQF
jgi:ribosome maturation factor RimP